MTPHIRLPHGVIKSPPPEFATEFVAGGWRRVERLYGRRLISRWVQMCGGDALIAQRRAAMGRKSGEVGS